MNQNKSRDNESEKDLIKQESRLRILESAKEGNTIELFSMIFISMQQYNDLLQSALLFKEELVSSTVQPQVCHNLDLLDVRLDYYMVMLQNLLLQDLFLPVNKLDFSKFTEIAEIVVDTFQSIRNRLFLLPLPEYVSSHYRVMLTLTHDLLDVILAWVTKTDPDSPFKELSRLQELEEEGDLKHRGFMKTIYDKDVSCKELHLFLLLDNFLEELLDSLQKLGNSAYIILYQYKIASRPLPKYLD